MTMILEKEKLRVELENEVQIAAYQNSGWREVRQEKKSVDAPRTKERKTKK